MNSDVFFGRYRVALWSIAVVSTYCWYSLLQTAMNTSTEPADVAKNDVAHVTKVADITKTGDANQATATIARHL